MKTSTLEVTIYVYIVDNRVIRNARVLVNGEKLVSVCHTSKGKFIPVQAIKTHEGMEV
jgi:hypothetical protein